MKELSHNDKKLRPLYARFVKNAVLEVFNLRTKSDFDEDIFRFDESEIEELCFSILSFIQEKGKCKILCIIKEQKSDLPHITFVVSNNVLHINKSNSKMNENYDFEIKNNLNTIIFDFVLNLFKIYPEIWLLKKESKTCYYCRWAMGYNGDRKETLEVVYSNSIRDINKAKNGENIVHSLLKRDEFGTWTFLECSDEKIKEISLNFISFLNEYREQDGLIHFRSLIEEYNAKELSLDFRFLNNKFSVMDWDCSEYDQIMIETKKILEYRRKFN